MKKLINGVVEFRRKGLEKYRAEFAHLALGQKPDALFVACSDSRVVPNTFASTDPGDLFVVRNVGNIVAPCGRGGFSMADESEAAALEFSLLELGVSNIVVCGHSECGAMKALLSGPVPGSLGAPHLESWLNHAKRAVARLERGYTIDPSLAPHNQLSQLNVLEQIENLKTYPLVQQRLREGKLHLQGWWFELTGADVHAYDAELGRFVILDEAQAQKIFATLDAGFQNPWHNADPHAPVVDTRC